MARERSKRLLTLICLLILCSILYAGLYPFHAPHNEVAWIPNTRAVQIGKFGAIRGTRYIPSSDSGERTLEIWIQPVRKKESSTFCAFYNPSNARHLSLRQSLSDLELRIEPSSAWSRATDSRFYVDDAFRNQAAALWTIASGSNGTIVYRDGVIARAVRTFRIAPQEFSGDLVIGTAPTFNDPWEGIVKGLGIYDVALSPDRVAQHYEMWTRRLAPDINAKDRCIALYLFNEGTGRVVHNRIDPRTDLEIPAKYSIVNQTVLDPAWKAFNFSWSFWKDAVLNVIGFMPAGYFFCVWFLMVGCKRPALPATAAGAGLSIFIELVQVHLPTRDSSMSDVITNIAGSAIGATAAKSAISRVVCSKVARALEGGPKVGR